MIGGNPWSALQLFKCSGNGLLLRHPHPVRKRTSKAHPSIRLVLRPKSRVRVFKTKQNFKSLGKKMTG